MSENWENKRKERRSGRWPRSIFGPLLLIVIGVVLLLDTLGMTGGSFWGIFLRYWPLLFVAGGLDSIYRREGVASGVFFGGLGVVILLSNMGYVQIEGWEVVLRLWPVLLVLWGFDILFGRRSIWTFLGGLLIGLCVLGAVSWLIVSPSSAVEGVVSRIIEQSLPDEVEQVSMHIEQTSGSLNISEGAEPSVLIAGQIDLGLNEEPYEYFKAEDETANYRLQSENDIWETFLQVGAIDRMEWSLQLNQKPELDLDSRVIIGEQKVDLSGLEITYHQNETIVGSSTLILPSGGDFDISMRVVFGEALVYVPEETPLRISLDTAFTSIVYPDDYERQEDEILSPGAENADEVIDLFVDIPFGSLNIVYLED